MKLILTLTYEEHHYICKVKDYERQENRRIL